LFIRHAFALLMCRYNKPLYWDGARYSQGRAQAEDALQGRISSHVRSMATLRHGGKTVHVAPSKQSTR
jgi:hypothetical protein